MGPNITRGESPCETAPAKSSSSLEDRIFQAVALNLFLPPSINVTIALRILPGYNVWDTMNKLGLRWVAWYKTKASAQTPLLRISRYPHVRPPYTPFSIDLETDRRLLYLIPEQLIPPTPCNRNVVLTPDTFL